MNQYIESCTEASDHDQFVDRYDSIDKSKYPDLQRHFNSISEFWVRDTKKLNPNPQDFSGSGLALAK